MEEFVKERSIRNCISKGYKYWQRHLGDTFMKVKWRLLLNAFMFTLAVLSYMFHFHWLISLAFLSLSLTNINVKARQLANGMELEMRGQKLITKNFAYYIGFMLHTGIIMLAVGLVVSVPVLLLLYMYYADLETVKMGDPTTITTLYWVILGVSIFVIHAIVAFIETTFAYAELYVCGTMVARNRPKKEEKNGKFAEISS